MADITKYCKAYYAKDMRKFPGFPGPPEVAVPDAGNSPDEDIVFLHDDLLVTAGIARDEGIIFRSAAAEWEKFCREDLCFEAPAWCSEEAAAPASGPQQ